MNLLVLCPLQKELEFLLAKLREKNFSLNEKQVGPLKVYECKELEWFIAQGGHGKTQFAVHTQFLIHQLEFVEAVVCAGCAGSLGEKVGIFDVVIAEKTIEHDFQLRFIKRPDPEFPADGNLMAKFKKVQPNTFQIHYGIIASGDEDIVEQTRKQELMAQTKAIAVAWEGAGGARACKLNRTAYIEVRGITDGADSTDLSSFEHNLKVVMNNVTEVLLKAFS